MAKIRRIRLKKRKYIPVPGISPGSIQLYKGALKPKISFYAYTTEEFYNEDINSNQSLELLLNKYKDCHIWIEIKGIGDADLLSFIEIKFNINKLVIEDIADCRQRPKLDDYDEYLFSVSRMLYVDKHQEIENEQVSFILFPKLLSI
jgi:magnesium transporter